MKVLSIFGTRPEAIKMAPVIRELQRHCGAGLQSITCVTAQHREMLDQILATFRISPDIDLELMQPDQTLASLSSRALIAITGVLDRHRPDLVLVQGDTTTAMIASMAAFYAKIRVGHIEAGLRTGDPHNPFPEEANRRIICVVADYHFAPTQIAVRNLRRDGVPDSQIFLTGNTVIDALLWAVNRQPSPECYRLLKSVGMLNDRLKTVLVTAHRRENFGKPLRDICRALTTIVTRNPNVQVVYPVHLNPNVSKPATQILGGRERIHLIQPPGYEQFAHMMKHAHMIMTDSGGVQEEAPALGKPVLVLRNDTERPEAVAAGSARLVGTETATIVAECERLLADDIEYARMTHVNCPYGDGQAARRVVEIICGQPALPLRFQALDHMNHGFPVPGSQLQN